jgi:hypothetical protein
MTEPTAGTLSDTDEAPIPDASIADATGSPEALPFLDAPTTVRVVRGGISEATADKVEVHLGGIGALQAEDVFVQWGGIGATRADSVGVEFGSIGAALAGEARVSQGFAGVVGAREATIEQAVVRTLIAQRVTILRPSAVLVLIAQKVEGEVRPLLDWRGGVAAGIGFAAVTALIRGIGSVRNGR